MRYDARSEHEVRMSNGQKNLSIGFEHPLFR